MRYPVVAFLISLAPAAFAQEAKSPQEEALKKLAADLPRLMKAADADGNGTLNVAEFRAFAPEVVKAGETILNALDPSLAKKKADKDVKKYDQNADGKLDDEEKKVMDEEARLKSIKGFDWDRDGKLSEKEKTAMGWAAEGDLIYRHRKVDTDANGELSSAEIEAGLSSISGIKVKKAKP